MYQKYKFIIYRKLIQQGKDDHDNYFMQLDFDKSLRKVQKIKETPYLSTVVSQDKEMEFKNILIIYHNHYLNFHEHNPYKRPLTTDLDFMYRRRTQNLCQGTVSYAYHLVS